MCENSNESEYIESSIYDLYHCITCSVVLIFLVGGGKAFGTPGRFKKLCT